MNKTIEQAANAAAEEVISKLTEQGYFVRKKGGKEKNAFQKTETLLYNYNNFKTAIKDKQSQIDYIKENGLDLMSKSITAFSKSNTKKTEAELAEEKIEALEKSILMTKYYITLLENSLNSISDDPYFDIIRMKYFEDLTMEKVAERLFVDISTVCRNKKRLIDALKIRLFSDEVIGELL